MQHAELATLLVGAGRAGNAGNADREALLRDHSAEADTKLAYILKDICLDGWSSDPARALAAASALRLLSNINGEPEISALCYWTAGLEALIQGQMGQAISNLEDASNRFIALGKPHVAASTEVSKVIALAMLGRYDEAIACGLHAREVFLCKCDILAAGKIEHNLGNLCFRRDRYHEAEEFQSAARERFSALNDQKQLATINNCLANTHARLHKFESAEELYDQAVVQAERAGVLVTQAEIEGNIGSFALLRGRYDRALDYLERSRRRYASLGMAHQSAMAEQEIADAYLELNLAPEAAQIYERVTLTFAQLGLRAEEARSLAYRGRALGLLGRSVDAIASLMAARKLYAAEGNLVGEAMVMLSQAQLHYGQENYALAKKMASEAESALVSSGSWQRLLLARWLQGEIERALGYSDRARLILDSTLADAILHGQPQVAEQCHTSLGFVAEERGDSPSAETHFRQAIRLTEELRAPLPGEEFRTAFFSNKLLPYTELVRLCLEGGDNRVTEALGVVESARSRALSDTLGGNVRQLTEARDEFEADLLRRMEALREELNYLYKQMDRPLRGERIRSKNELSELQQQLVERESKILEVSRQLQHRGEVVSSHFESFDVEELQQQLGRERALVEYTTIDDELLAFVVTNERVEVLRNLGAESEVAAEVEQFRFQIDTLRHGTPLLRKHMPVLTKRVRTHLESLYDSLLRRIEPTIENRSLIVVPHRTLHYLPLQALHDGTSYLIQRREISYAPSALVLLQCLARSSGQTRPSSQPLSALLLGVADDQIPRVHDEIEAIGKVFPGAASFLDEAATTEVLRENAAGADVIHLACHARFRADNPLFSSLRLGDGWFTVREAYGLKLDGSLVTLSACETGVNSITPGDELIGLARGFFSAGSPSILLSLWTVDDEATADLMAYFYAELVRHGSPGKALRAAQIKLLGEKPHPFFWSPFIVVGRG